ncbi:uncharacterized protein [Lepeophtheirus salmonis]|uniref:uncharacterized protein n=1 Tax=Lepeophtheirus salmonis TaxID=72036 RepID=UPI001AE9D754|nr:uncharacterized protein LOC121117094 [Lepeophtheirus salmonis]
MRRTAQLLITISSFFWTVIFCELKFDLDGNLLDDGLSRALSHSPEGFDIVIEEASEPSSTTNSIPSMFATATNSNSNLFDIIKEDGKSHDNNVLLTTPEPEKVQGGSIVKIVPGGKKIIVQNIHQDNLVKKREKEIPLSSNSDDYQYLSYPQDNDQVSVAVLQADSTQSIKSKMKKFMKQVIEASDTTPQEVQTTTTKAMSSTEQEPTTTTLLSDSKESSEPKKELTKKMSIKKDQEHTIDSIIPCTDIDEVACQSFKPLCKIEIEIGFRRCQKTCGFCKGKRLIYEAKISNGVEGLVEFQQFYPRQPVYMAGCFEKSGIKNTITPHAFVIHERSEEPSMKDSKCPHAGAHWNPYGSLHGDPHSQGYHHQGDLGNILINRSSVPPPQSWPENGAICSEDQASAYQIYYHLDFFFNPPEGLILSIHSKDDDFGKNFFKAESRKTGQVGNSLACGIIEYKSDTEDDAAVNEQDTPSTKKDKPINGTSSIVKIEKKNAPKLGSNVTSDAVQFEFRQTTTLNPKIILENKELPTNIIDTPNISVDNNGIGLTAHLIPNEINQIREERRILTDTKKIVSMNKNNEPLQINESPSPEAVREFPLGGFSRGNQVKILETIDNSQKDSNTREKIQDMLNNLNAQRSLSPGLTNFQKNDGTSLNKFIIDRSRTITSDDATKSEEQQLSGTKIMNSIVADNKGKHLDIIDSNNNMNIIDGHKFLGGGTTEQNQLNGKVLLSQQALISPKNNDNSFRLKAETLSDIDQKKIENEINNPKLNISTQNNSEIIEPNNDNLEVNEETSRINQTASNILNQLRNANIRELLNNRKIDENETELIKENMNNKQLEPSEDKLKGSDEIEEGVKRQLILSRESASRSGGVEEVEDLALKNHAGSNDKSIKFLPDSQDIDQETLNSNNMDEFKNKTTELPHRRSPILIKRNNFDGSRENEEVTNSNGNRKPIMQTKLRNSSRSSKLLINENPSDTKDNNDTNNKPTRFFRMRRRKQRNLRNRPIQSVEKV